jgi:cell wall-associated NlpC family hydrolase
MFNTTVLESKRHIHLGICPLSVVPMRQSPSQRSEMLSQLLFGETVEVLEEKGKQWCKVRTSSDNFIAWVESNQLKAITPSEFERYNAHFAYNLELVQPIMGADHFIPITIGARLPEFDGIRFRFGEVYYSFSGQAISPGDLQPNADFILKLAKRYLNTPFLWGGRSPFGIDSPALVQLVFQMVGYKMPREAAAQIELGDTIDFIENAQAGDLAFFENNQGRISHVGILMPEGKLIHCYGGVRIDKVDHYGIYDEARQVYSKRLRLIKRILPTLVHQATLAERSAIEGAGVQAELF